MTLPKPPVPRVVGPVTLTDFVRYQGASGDLNPVHHDPAAAASAGFPRPFAPGMWAAGLLGTLATDWLGPQNVRRFSVRFAEQIWPGDVLTCTAEVLAGPDDGTPLVDVALTCRRQTGAAAVVATATFVVPVEVPHAG
jgi:acyl dehydratase